MGVAEHVFDVNIHGKAVAWHLFDVGGARGQRHSWVPFFGEPVKLLTPWVCLT
jgi:guanine nucleotide-binding protein subunit alpha